MAHLPYVTVDHRLAGAQQMSHVLELGHKRIGVIADRFEFVVDGDVKGNLANAFLIVTPLVFVGAAILLRGRRYVSADIERARQAAAA